MSLSLDQLRVCYPKATSQNIIRFIEPINETLEKYEINTPNRIAIFLAQAGHESGQLVTTVENLNYKADRLLIVFPKYFDAKSAVSFAGKPEAIANHVYANRLGNGPETSGDGWKYRGRGIFQNTGKDEYARLGKVLGVDLVSHPELLEGSVFATLAAGDFWKLKEFNNVADKPTTWRREYKGVEYNPFEWITLRINGGQHGLKERLELYANAKKALNIAA